MANVIYQFPQGMSVLPSPRDVKRYDSSVIRNTSKNPPSTSSSSSPPVVVVAAEVHETRRQARMRAIADGFGVATMGMSIARGSPHISRPSPYALNEVNASRAVLRLPVMGGGGGMGLPMTTTTPPTSSSFTAYEDAANNGSYYSPFVEEGSIGVGGGRRSPLPVGFMGSSTMMSFGGGGALISSSSNSNSPSSPPSPSSPYSPQQSQQFASSSSPSSTSPAAAVRLLHESASTPLYAERARMYDESGIGGSLWKSYAIAAATRMSEDDKSSRRTKLIDPLDDSVLGQQQQLQYQQSIAAANKNNADDEEDAELLALVGNVSSMNINNIHDSNSGVYAADGGGGDSGSSEDFGGGFTGTGAANLQATLVWAGGATGSGGNNDHSSTLRGSRNRPPSQQQPQLGAARSELVAATGSLSPEQRLAVRRIRAAFAPYLFSDLLESYHFFAAARVPAFSLAVWEIAAGVFRDALLSAGFISATTTGATVGNNSVVVPISVLGTTGAEYARAVAAALSRCVAGTYSQSVVGGPPPTPHGAWSPSKAALQFACRSMASQALLRNVLDDVTRTSNKAVTRATAIASASSTINDTTVNLMSSNSNTSNNNNSFNKNRNFLQRTSSPSHFAENTSNNNNAFQSVTSTYSTLPRASPMTVMMNNNNNDNMFATSTSSGRSSPTSPMTSPSPQPALTLTSSSSSRQWSPQQQQQQQLLQQMGVGLRYDPQAPRARPASLSLSPMRDYMEYANMSSGGGGNGQLLPSQQQQQSYDLSDGVPSPSSTTSSSLEYPNSYGKMMNSSLFPTIPSNRNGSTTTTTNSPRLPPMSSPAIESYSKSSAPLLSSRDLASSSLSSIPAPAFLLSAQHNHIGAVSASVLRSSTLAPPMKVYTSEGILEGSTRLRGMLNTAGGGNNNDPMQGTDQQNGSNNNSNRNGNGGLRVHSRYMAGRPSETLNIERGGNPLSPSGYFNSNNNHNHHHSFYSPSSSMIDFNQSVSSSSPRPSTSAATSFSSPTAGTGRGKSISVLGSSRPVTVSSRQAFLSPSMVTSGSLGNNSSSNSSMNNATIPLDEPAPPSLGTARLSLLSPSSSSSSSSSPFNRTSENTIMSGKVSPMMKRSSPGSSSSNGIHSDNGININNNLLSSARVAADRLAAEQGLVRARTAYSELDRLMSLSKRVP